MLLTSIFSLLLSNSLGSRRDISLYYSRIGINMLIFCLFLSYTNLYVTYLDLGIGLFGGLFSISSITSVFHILILILTLLILNLTSFFPRTVIKYYTLTLKKYIKDYFKIIKKREQYGIIEYTLIILFIIMGSLLLISSNDLVSVYLSIELQSYGLYLLCTIYRNSESSTSSGLTYFLLGGLSSSFILLGIGLIYANSGTTYLDNFYIITNISNIIQGEVLYNSNIATYIPYCLLLITIGFLFKISAAPFHFWSPDVYDGIPTIVTTFVSIIPKISILVILFFLVHFTNNTYILTEYTWTYSLLISSLLSLIIGTVMGLTQFRIKRLFAYSTISHVGFLLLALSINSVESIQSFIFYLIQYSISNLNAFFLLITIGYTLYFFENNKIFDNYNININLIDKNNSPIQLLSQIKGYFYVNQTLALSLAITLFSFAGIPPLVGFFAKQMVLSAALQDGFIFLSLIAVFTSVIGAVYYLNIVKIMFFDIHSYEWKNIIFKSIPEDDINKLPLSSHLSITISILTLIILLFMFIPDQLLQLCNIISLIFFTSFA
uniref:NADH dehydrogenase subunit 2 n=1 Tax=Ajellomyces dermatitidis TaxID=5039 RepID=UPI0001AA025C|nr:NADH dehydrogenase subunit 2 [Blastomyces dermatitidis]YP_010944546.1 NADH dehydrogenase subunit 2 [Blastomyces gilchristii]WLW42175.1 NADH dehydrogenase subunit 2 [Blastomyces dermatitidis]WMB97393.1 NADH dehydrogenase subunit 2 [Blastomyces dermatitidis]WMB97408.1 NADH dehydrogenase subunit 2 [Blastomyces dermatitidis]WMB97422.1 NADH dehydrogenase subunit 2 [Blastomyces gilchristii]